MSEVLNNYITILSDILKNNYTPKKLLTGKTDIIENKLSFTDLLSLPVNQISANYAIFELIANNVFWLYSASFETDLNTIIQYNDDLVFNDFLLVMGILMNFPDINNIKLSIIDGFILGQSVLGVDKLGTSTMKKFTLGESRLGIDKFVENTANYSFTNIDYARVLLARTIKFFGFSTPDNFFLSLSYLFGISDISDISLTSISYTNKRITINIKNKVDSVTRSILKYTDSHGDLLYTSPPLYTILLEA